MVKIEIAKKFLDSLHGHFMITPVDKVNDNITVISKPFYTKVLIKGLGIDNKLNANSTYENLPNTNKTFYFSLILGLFFRKLTIGKWGKSMSTFNLLDS